MEFKFKMISGFVSDDAQVRVNCRMLAVSCDGLCLENGTYANVTHGYIDRNGIFVEMRAPASFNKDYWTLPVLEDDLQCTRDPREGEMHSTIYGRPWGNRWVTDWRRYRDMLGNVEFKAESLTRGSPVYMRTPDGPIKVGVVE